MGFHHNAVFPERLSYGTRGGPGYQTTITTSDGGAETRISRWQTPRLTFDVAESLKTAEDYAELLTFYRARGGSANGFLFRDPFDHSSADTHIRTESFDALTDVQEFGVGDGSTVEFQLSKTYTDTPSGVSHIRTITRPIPGTVSVRVKGAGPLVEGPDYTVNYETGVVRLPDPLGSGLALAASYEFRVPVRFGADIDERFNGSYDAFDALSIDTVPIVELKDELPIPEEISFGGASTVDLGFNNQVEFSNGRVQLVATALSQGPIWTLPDVAGKNYPRGGPYFFLVNGASNGASVLLRRADGTFAATIPNGGAVEILLGPEDWIALPR